MQAGGYLVARDGEKANVSEAVRDKAYIDFAVLFDNENPVDLDVGCGKGKFTCNKAISAPEVNILGVEFISNVLILGAERAMEEGIKNVRFLNTVVECLPRYVRSGAIRNIYINFPTPLPKKNSEKQRLTCRRFLDMYADLLSPNGRVVLKTDNKPFFDYSLEQFVAAGYTLERVIEDIHAVGVEGNVLTEHEEMYVKQGLPIYMAEAKPNKE